MIKKLIRCFKSWTINYALLLTIAGTVQANIAALELTAKQTGYAMIALGIITALLRAKTGKPLNER